MSPSLLDPRFPYVKDAAGNFIIQDPATQALSEATIISSLMACGIPANSTTLYWSNANGLTDVQYCEMVNQGLPNTQPSGIGNYLGMIQVRLKGDNTLNFDAKQVIQNPQVTVVEIAEQLFAQGLLSLALAQSLLWTPLKVVNVGGVPVAMPIASAPAAPAQPTTQVPPSFFNFTFGK